jgi:tetratricopeptide (TPR) repeat protein
MTVRGANAAALVCLGVVLGTAPAPRAHEDAGPPAADARIGTVARALMERPVALTDAAGRMPQAVTTAAPEAQAYYDQGIAFLASYAFVDASRAFHEALRRDPDLAMAHLQLAKTYVNVDALDDARRHFARAQALADAGGVTWKEAKWIALGLQQRAAVEAPDDRQAAEHYAYKVAIEELIALDPADPHAWVLRGNAEEYGAWGRGQHGYTASIAFYETALRRDPDHLGAQHFLVHSYENIGRYAEAAAYGKTYAAAAKGVPHAQHMYGHVLPRLGRWEEALAQFEQADRLERAYYAAEKIAPEEDWHRGHNLHLFAMVQLRLGHDAAAARLLEEAYRLDTRGPFGGGSAAPWIEYLLLRARFDEALAAARATEARPLVMAQLVGAALGGQALVALGRTDEAEQALERAKARYEELVVRAKDTFYEPFAPRYAGPFITTLEAEIGLRGPNGAEAEAQTLAMADAVAHDPRIDAWAVGLFHIARVADDARRAGKPALAAALVERLHAIDPEFSAAP